MALSVRELVAALPEEAEEERGASQGVARLARELSMRPAPIGVLRRFWTMGSMQSKVALAYLSYWLRSSFAGATEKERLLNETRLRSAIALVSGMGYLRGIALKMGQMLANYPNVVPREFAELLGSLNFEAPPMHFALLRERVRAELGGDPEEVFAEFETRAFAAASLGQVHRARLKTGERVAVKIQYPGIARTIDSDIRGFLGLLAPMRLSKDWESLRAQIEDVRMMLMQETDYRKEAEFLRRGREVFGADEGIAVPRVFEGYSTSRVLTMELLDGVHLEEYLGTHRSQAERDRYGELLMRASFRLIHKGRIWYSDSNPGNYLFLRDGRLGVIDFGCCREFSEEEWDYYVEMGRAHRTGGERLRCAIVRSLGGKNGMPSEDQLRLLEEMANWYSDYLLHDGAWEFGDEAFMQRGLDLMKRFSERRQFATAPVNIWVCRQLLGLRAIAYRLRARINMKALDEQESVGIWVDAAGAAT